MKEYEYSFKVSDILPYIKYCKDNGYILKEESSQIRVLYKNINKTMARITTKKIGNFKKIILDFKDDNKSEEILKVSRETLPLEITDNELDAIYSILDMLEYKKDITLIRDRFVYEKENVKFELDIYSSPEKMYVAAIEGKKEEVDIVYNNLSDVINNTGKV